MRYDRLLDGKTVWITGGATPPYDVYARLFYEHGAKLIIIDGKAEDGCKLVDDIGQLGGADVVNGGASSAFGGASSDLGTASSAMYHECDLFDSTRVEALCNELLIQYGAPDVYLHVADTFIPAFIDELAYSDLELMLAISVTTPFAVIKSIAAQMATANGGGAIVLVSGHYGIQGMNRVSGYGAAKGSEISMAYSLAVEYAADNIRINTIAPGVSFPPVGDALLAQSKESDSPDFWGTVQPFRRRGRMDELANAALFLASNMADYITGEVLLVNGAQHLIAHNHNFPHRDIPLPQQKKR